MGVLDQPLALGSVSCMLSTSLPRWKRADLVVSAVCYTCTCRAVVRENSKAQQGKSA